MKRSIRTKLFLGMTALIGFYFALTWFLNTQYLQEYYINAKKNDLMESNEKITSVYNGDPIAIAPLLEQLESTKGISILILDEEGKFKYNSRYRIVNGMPFYPTSENVTRLQPSSNLQRTQQHVADNIILETQKDPYLKREALVLESKLTNGDSLVLKVTLSAIAESVALANHFMLFSGLLVLFIGSLWSFIFSKRFTQPILEIKDSATRMANLDFSKKCKIRSQDELEDLAICINHMSNQLDSAIRELNEKNQKLAEDIKREQQIDEMRKEFISSVSHELKTPISLIMGYAEGLKENIATNEEDRNFYCDVIMDEAKKMDKMVKDLLYLARLETDFFELDKSVFDISILIGQVLAKYQVIFRDQSINVLWETHERLLVHADRIQISYVLMNFINNAVSHVDEQKQLGVEIINKNDRVRVYIMNSGRNIPEKDLIAIWSNFYKLDKARTRESGRVGLGLAIVKAIQERHHNSYGVENINHGVKFWFELDIA